MFNSFYKTAQQHLAANCPVMKRLIARIGPCTLAPLGGDPFTLLVRCVIAQQISTQAAQSIFGRLVTVVTGQQVTEKDCPSIPLAVLAQFTEGDYKACGISGPKQRALRALVEHVQANPALLPSIPEMADEVVREKLLVIKGIGPWTVDMFLLLGLGRPDIWPVGDYGVKVAVKKLFRLRQLPDTARLMRTARPWIPYRSVASWYLWRSLEPVPVTKASENDGYTL